MALTVTPGGASDDAMVSLADFKAYCDARGYDYSSYDDTTEIEPAIRRATVFVEGVGGPTENLPTRWPGVRSSSSQRRVWPRSGAAYVDGTVIDSTVIPAPVEDAICEAAFFDLGNPGVLHSQITPSEVVKSAGAGPAKVTFQDPQTERDARPMLTVISDLLAGLLVPDLKGPSLYMRSVGSLT